MRKVLIGLGAIVGALLVLLLAYAAYVLLNMQRIEDDLPLDVAQNAVETVETGREYTLLTWNLGFGAYSDDFSFFMDGGEHARALSRAAVEENISAMAARVRELDPDFALLQEVDMDADRSWHVDERAMLVEAFPEMSNSFAVNYDSPYLFYPFHDPIGRSLSGILTLTGARVDEAVRRSLPLESGLTRLTDLDRCYTVSRLPLANGATLCLYNVHLSAYTSDGSISTEQARLLLADMAAEYAQGNYALAGGDFNKDLPGDSGADYAWAQPFPTELLPEGITLYAPENAHTSRYACEPYDPATAVTITLDGFLASENIEVLSCEAIEEGFTHSDHEPAVLRFKLVEG